jgi:parallel beta-helix repeat protein
MLCAANGVETKITGYRRVSMTSIAVLMGTVGALLLLSGLGQPAWADPGTLYVAPNGDDAQDCSSYTNRCRTVQRAVDVANLGDEILVATGVYTGVHSRDYEMQVVYISKTVTVRGGYSTDLSTWNPGDYPTTLDAGAEGRVVYVTGDISPTLEGLRLTNGSAGEFDNGGGICAVSAHSVISGCQIFSNTANSGGGIYLEGSAGASLVGNQVFSNMASFDGGINVYNSDDVALIDNEVFGNSDGGIGLSSSDNATLMSNEVHGNTGGGFDGGVYLSGSVNAMLIANKVFNNTSDGNGGGVALWFGSDNATLTGNEVCSNTANSDGGGIYLDGSANAMLTNNKVFSNTASWRGGGVIVEGSDNATLMGNEIYRNMANWDGGGVHLSDSDGATLTNNEIHHNTAGWGGGGVVLRDSHSATLVNNMVVENRLTSSGSDGAGIQMAGSAARSLHTTIARNSGGNGSGVSVVCTWSGSTCDPSTIAMTNTILVSHTVGIEVREHNTAMLAATLWGDGGWANGTDIGGIGGGTVVSGTNFWGLPAFVDPGGGDYHIGPGAAINRGVDAGVMTDLDGDPRPAPPGTLPDLGADEFNQRCVYLPLVLRAR